MHDIVCFLDIAGERNREASQVRQNGQEIVLDLRPLESYGAARRGMGLMRGGMGLMRGGLSSVSRRRGVRRNVSHGHVRTILKSKIGCMKRNASIKASFQSMQTCL